MSAAFISHLQSQIEATKEDGLYKKERVITSQQQADIGVAGGEHVINFCANNYLGLANNESLIEAAKNGLDSHGFGVASVRFICGTQDIHKQLETSISDFLGTEDTILYPSCFDANGGLFETLLGPEDAIISDALNHASIIDGVRLCKAKRYRYANNDMAALEEQLKQANADGARFKIIATDGVFSMDGVIADLASICDLADKYDAMVMVDDCHATGFLGENGKGSHEYCGVMGRVDIITGTLGKALGGASGGYTSGKKEVVEWLRQRSRPYLFSNSVAPPIVSASLKVFEMMKEGDELRANLWRNANHFRKRMEEAGFTLAGKDHAIIPVMLGDARLASEMADKLLEKGIYVIGFSYPVVPKGQARIRTQMSAGHSLEHVDKAIDAFIEVGREMGVIS
ncbi:glycine C-acetyltransferase [Alteromonas mediterranea]|jgi:glycine C-acetyltransferase|uniref:2-amino-3-ketobutyrate coenzyme A ligase n=2 Tax=Alteromonas mediterranea TaxID=314275 RepID=A0AAC8XGG7_9ALTE|nr:MULTISPECIES: glycine C-acetyltransferase [Alteromonas]AGP91812.1 2-amino-3-ketobutyrate coenzyme A ligase [Alteromonas mediterranea U8]MBR9895259.1 glycine C-acetyltransferase [Gammaproteobacteria bacterium]MEA3379321.1 glycine C-acetyltransferase [Pseudomonadota bacterium]AEA96212.1 2-amino-3-ketobutyrate CoA ligase [Alteromonas mediterranea DE]AFV83594.1 2-amino-3-ketobutyrate coenzyme A ligase [Alteromonas mediterranea DE1]|tara:strand:- start:2942 stop:4138 length:1197 start_codon:yes stop_codon:yes gene_type:complete